MRKGVAASTHPGAGKLPQTMMPAWFEGVCQHPGEWKPQHLSATTHLRNNHMYGGVNIGAFITYYIGAFNIQLTEYNHNLRKADIYEHLAKSSKHQRKPHKNTEVQHLERIRK